VRSRSPSKATGRACPGGRSWPRCSAPTT
jgi:hypothetical protein